MDEDLGANVIVQIKGLKKQKQHNDKYGIIVHHSLNQTTNRYKVRLLEDDEWNNENQNKPQTKMINIMDDSKQNSTPPSPFKHICVKAINLLPLCNIEASSFHKDGIMALRKFKPGDKIFSDIPLIGVSGFSLLWSKDASNQILKLWKAYKEKLGNDTKRAYFDEVIHYDTNNMVCVDTQRAINKLCNEPTFKLQYLSDDYKESEFDFDKWSKMITKFRMNAIYDFVFYVSSSINHSCRANAYINKKGQIFATRNISKGHEILISYFERDADLYKDVQRRKLQIQRTFGFECKCFRCNPLKPANFQFDDARNFKCQFCSWDGAISWNSKSSRFFTKCNNMQCEKFPSSQHQTKFMQIEKKLGVLLLDGNEKDLKEIVKDAQKYLINHYLLVALYHRLCQTNLKMHWLKARYETMCNVYNEPNEYLLRAATEYYRFIPLLNAATENKSDDECVSTNQSEQSMKRLQTHIASMDKALGL